MAPKQMIRTSKIIQNIAQTQAHPIVQLNIQLATAANKSTHKAYNTNNRKSLIVARVPDKISTIIPISSRVLRSPSPKLMNKKIQVRSHYSLSFHFFFLSIIRLRIPVLSGRQASNERAYSNR